jgi:alpha-beta hydrolase superfamily lysophospholipase
MMERAMAPLKWIFGTARWLLAVVGLFALIIVGLLASPLVQPPELKSIREGAIAVDQSGMPDTSRFQARDGTSLAYRLYPAAAGDAAQIAIIIHGSAGHSKSMNQIAKRVAAAGFTVVSLDIRGHGESGTRGDISYIGQLDDDLEDLVAELRRQYRDAHFSLLGFSAGGGFALRVAAGKLNSDLDRLILVSPYLGYDAPSSRPAGSSALWANPDIPRFIAISLLDRIGLRCCESMPVIAFAVAPGSERAVTPQYSYRLVVNFAAPPDRTAAFRQLKMPTTIIVGAADELMLPDKYADIVGGVPPAIEIKILPGLGHMDMLHAPAAVDAIAAAFAGN